MAELTRDMMEALRRPFPAREISFKVQTKPNEKGNSLVVAYIDARNVMERLDEVAGPDWSDRYEKAGTSQGLVCYLTVGGVTRADVGDDNNPNEAVKSAYSDAFKRAAVKFGVGRFLYDLPKMWAKARPIGNSFALEDGELARLQRIVDDHLAGRGSANAPRVQQAQAQKPGPVKPLIQREQEQPEQPAQPAQGKAAQATAVRLPPAGQADNAHSSAQKAAAELGFPADQKPPTDYYYLSGEVVDHLMRLTRLDKQGAIGALNQAQLKGWIGERVTRTQVEALVRKLNV